MIRLIQPALRFEDVEADYRRMFASGMFTRGENVEAFRNELAAYLGAKHLFLTTSATTALGLCLRLLGIGPGDEVIVSDFSFPATANVVEDVGARPVFADVSPDTWNVLPATLEARITPRTRAVIFVDAFGNPGGLHDVAALCRARGLPLIEDAACAIGSAERGVRCGAVADLTCFSFHPRKVLTTGEGGAIATQRDDWAAWLQVKLNHGASGMQGPALDFVDYGYNLRLSEPQAIMGRAQLPKLDAVTAARREVARACHARLQPAGFVPQQVAADVLHNVQSLVYRVPEGVDRDVLIAALRTRGVESTIGTYCLSGTTYFRKRYADVQPQAWRLYGRTITLPCYPGLDSGRVCDEVLGALEGCRR